MTVEQRPQRTRTFFVICTGFIDVASTVGQGTTFSLRFRAASTQEPRRAAQVPAAMPSRRLLLIDDDPEVRQTLASLLRELGHTVAEAEGGSEGLAQLRGTSVDMVLTDLGMPEMTGWEVARQIRAGYPRLPIVLLTGWGEQAGAEVGTQNVVDRVLSKPVRLVDLTQAIQELTASPQA